MELQEASVFVDGCFHDEPASCECACPFHLELRAFLKKMARGRWPAAYRDLCGAIPFPSVAAALCPRPCAGRCQRPAVGGSEPIDMGALERACIDFAAAERAAKYPLPPKTQRVAVVGAGPAGLSCALLLARKKYQVTVFERDEGWGGHLRSHPEFPRFQADFEKQFAGQPVEFRFSFPAEESVLTGFDAVYIATGSGGAAFGLSDGWDPVLYTTARPGWFLGGSVCGTPLMESMAAAARLSQLMEAYLQTGRASLIVAPDGSDCPGHFVDHSDVAPAPRVVPAAPEQGYTKEEARAEASRCMMCVCESCMTGCEVLAHYRKAPAKLAFQISADSHTTPPLSNCEATRQTYSCNLCSRCGSLCSEGVDMGRLFQFSREDRWKQGKWIPGLFDYWLHNMDFNGSEGFYASKGRCRYLFFPGCQLTASCPSHVLDAWHFLAGREDTGIVLSCCGAPAVWAGDLTRQAAQTRLLTEVWEAMGKPVFLTACATCAEMLRRQLPDAAIRSLYELLDELDAPTAPLPFGQAAVFDPCAAGRDDLLHRSVLSLAKKAGCRPAELRDGGTCCGYGGHMRLANPQLYQEITEKRAAESELPYIVYCANCLEVFRTRGKPAVHILDGVFGGSNSSKTPTLEEKRRNILRVKDAVMNELEQTHFIAPALPWDSLTVNYAPEARANMEDKLITDRDVQEAIYTAERDVGYFADDTGLRTACLTRQVLTYWVDYRVSAPGVFTVENAYCHRMHIGEEQTP